MSIKRKFDEDKIVFLSIIGGMCLVLTIAITVGIHRYGNNDKDTNVKSLSTDKGSLLGREKSDNVGITANATADKDNPDIINSVELRFNSNASSQDVTINDEYIQKETRDFTKSMSERKNWDLGSSTNTSTTKGVSLGNNSTRTLKFSDKYSADFKEINTILYQLVDKYYNPTNFGDAKYKDYVDPLYIMAISNVEFGEETSPKVLLAPAVPTSKGAEVTKENILTFGIQDYLKYPSILSNDRDGYRGPLQMYVTGLPDGIIPGDLVGSEYTRLVSAPESPAKRSEMNSLEYVEGSNRSSSIDGMRLDNKPGNYGDRFNYGDSVNRLSQYVKDCWGLYYKTDVVDKTGNKAIDNKYSFMAMTAIGHNSTPGIYYIGDSKNLSSKFYWWPYGNFGEAREFCHYLGNQSCVDYIKQMALNNLKGSKSITEIFKLSRMQGYAAAADMVNKGYIPSGLWKRENWNHEEKIGYPIQVLYNYFLLEAIYEGEV